LGTRDTFHTPTTSIIRGKFGEVRQCVEKKTKFTLAAKLIACPDENDKVSVRKEIDIMADLRHPKVLQIYDAFEQSKQMCIITEM